MLTEIYAKGYLWVSLRGHETATVRSDELGDLWRELRHQSSVNLSAFRSFEAVLDVFEAGQDDFRRDLAGCQEIESCLEIGGCPRY